MQDIKYDSIFKMVFGSVKNKEYTKRLLELILKRKINKIDVESDVTLDRISKESKVGILDVRAIIDEEVIVNIEMQKENEGDIIERTEKYGSNIYIGNIKKGEKYEEAKEIILINILDYKINKYKEVISKTIRVLEKHRECEIRTKIKIYFIELPKIVEGDVNIKDELTQWLIYLYGKERRLLDMVIKENKKIKKLDKQVKYLQGIDEDVRMEQLRFKWQCDMEYAKRRSREQGEKSGIIKGRVEGKEEERKDNILSMIRLNIPDKLIMQIMKIDTNELQKIKETI